jgi:predicted Zn finger-like uncharacterized protein
MKFVCERCQTKYSIADEKVRQKVLKIRCKTCENVITIRDAVVVAEPAAPRIEPPPAPVLGGPPAPQARAQRSIEWHLAISGQQTGPFGLAALVTRILAVPPGGEVYVWNEHLDGWKEPKAIPEVAAELRLREAAPLPPPVRRAPTPSGLAGPQAQSMRPSIATQPAPILGRGGRSNSAAVAAVDHFAAPGEEEKTQISALDASMLMGGGDPHLAATRPQPAFLPAAQSGAHPAISAHAPGHGGGLGMGHGATAHAPVKPNPAAYAHAHAPAQPIGRQSSSSLPASSSPPARPVTQEVPHGPPAHGNGHPSRKSDAHPATGLEGLDFSPSLRAPSRANISAVALPLAPAAAARPSTTNGAAVNGGVVAPVLGGSTSMLLSQVGGRASKPRHPALKFAVMGGVVLVLGGVMAAVTMSGSEKARTEKTAPTTAPAAPADPEAVARAEAEKYFKSMVGTTANPPAPAPVTKTVAPSPPRRSAAKTKAEPAPVALAPPPVSGSAIPGAAFGEGSRVTQRFAQDERKVAVPTKASSKASEEFDMGKFMGVFKQPDHVNAIKTCYDRALKRDDSLKLGRLDINVTVGETGSAKKVKVVAPAEFNLVSTCIHEVVRRWHFPATNREYDAAFPVILQGKSD